MNDNITQQVNAAAPQDGVRFARPVVEVRTAVFGIADGVLRTLLLPRTREPFANHWTLPGGALRITESLDEAAARGLREQVGLKCPRLAQVSALGDVDRDPRGRVIAVLFVAMAPPGPLPGEQTGAAWYPVNGLPPMAFDHGDMLTRAYQHLQLRVCLEPAIFDMLPKTFTLTQLQQAFEAILDEELDKRNFRRKIEKDDFLHDTGDKEAGGARRPAALYSFDRRRYRQRLKEGWRFQF